MYVNAHSFINAAECTLPVYRWSFWLQVNRCQQIKTALEVVDTENPAEISWRMAKPCYNFMETSNEILRMLG